MVLRCCFFVRTFERKSFQFSVRANAEREVAEAQRKTGGKFLNPKLTEQEQRELPYRLEALVMG